MKFQLLTLLGAAAALPQQVIQPQPGTGTGIGQTPNTGINSTFPQSQFVSPNAYQRCLVNDPLCQQAPALLRLWQQQQGWTTNAGQRVPYNPVAYETAAYIAFHCGLLVNRPVFSGVLGVNGGVNSTQVGIIGGQTGAGANPCIRWSQQQNLNGGINQFPAQPINNGSGISGPRSQVMVWNGQQGVCYGTTWVPVQNNQIVNGQVNPNQIINNQGFLNQNTNGQCYFDSNHCLNIAFYRRLTCSQGVWRHYGICVYLARVERQECQNWRGFD